MVYILRIVTNPLFGFLLDYFKKFRLTISLSLIALALSHVCWIFVPQKESASCRSLKDDFTTRLQYFCQHDEFSPGSCDEPKLMIYSEYLSSQRIRSASDEFSFTCDLECTYYSTTTSEMVIDFGIVANVSECDLKLRIAGGEVVLGETVENFRNSASFDGVSVKSLQSWTSNADNCSVTRPPNRQGLEQNGENNSSLIDPLPVSETSTPVFLNTSLVQTYGASYEFEMDFKPIQQHPFEFHRNNSNRSFFEFGCRTQRCRHPLGGSAVGRKRPSVDFASVQFLTLSVLITVSCVLIGGLIAMMDTVCYELLQEDKKSEYGRQRLWGTVGWGVGAVAAGYVNQINETDSGDTDYTFSFYLLAILLLLDVLAIHALDVKSVSRSPNIARDVCLLFTKLDVIYNASMVCLIGGLSEFLWSYQFWFMQELGSGQLLLGLSEGLQSAFELPCFLASGWVLQRIGHAHCLSVTLLCFALRYLCFAVMRDPWWTLAAALFHGPTFGLFYASMTMYAKERAPPGTEATVQSLQHLCFEGIGKNCCRPRQPTTYELPDTVRSRDLGI